MTPVQIEGLWICLTFSLALTLLCPVFLWVLPNRNQAA